MNETDKFLASLTSKDQTINLSPEKVEVKEEVKDEPKEPVETPTNREIRRLKSRLEKAEGMNVQLTEIVKKNSILEQYAKEHPEEDPLELKVFGTDENGKLLKSYFDNKFEKIREESVRQAKEELEAATRQNSEEENRLSSYIDESFEKIEDTYNVDLSGETKASRELRNDFIDFVESISQKDGNGEIVEYPDMEGAYKAFSRLNSKEKPKEVSIRQKELGSRGMTPSTSSQPNLPRQRLGFNNLDRIFDRLQGN